MLRWLWQPIPNFTCLAISWLQFQGWVVVLTWHQDQVNQESGDSWEKESVGNFAILKGLRLFQTLLQPQWIVLFSSRWLSLRAGPIDTDKASRDTLLWVVFWQASPETLAASLPLKCYCAFAWLHSSCKQIPMPTLRTWRTDNNYCFHCWVAENNCNIKKYPAFWAFFFLENIYISLSLSNKTQLSYNIFELCFHYMHVHFEMDYNF